MLVPHLAGDLLCDELFILEKERVMQYLDPL